MADEEAQLLAASRAAYQRIAENHKQSASDFVDGTDLVLLDDKQEKPHISATALKPKSKGKARADDPPELKPYLESVERDGVVSQRKPTKRQIREHREKTAGKQWFDMPEFPGSRYASKDPRSRTEHGKSSYTGGDARAATEKEMRRQVVAIRLRNALDPKRYYRGGTGAEKDIPKYAQLGRIVGGGLEPASILTRKERAPSAVGELTRDTGTRAYSKRKFDEVCVIPADPATRAQSAQRQEQAKELEASLIDVAVPCGWHVAPYGAAPESGRRTVYCAPAFCMPD